MAAKKKVDVFEESMQKLQAIVEKLERGEMPLDDALESFSEGVRLARECHKKLEEAENRVRLLTKDQDGNWSAAPFDTEPGENAR